MKWNNNKKKKGTNVRHAVFFSSLQSSHLYFARAMKRPWQFELCKKGCGNIRGIFSHSTTNIFPFFLYTAPVNRAPNFYTINPWSRRRRKKWGIKRKTTPNFERYHSILYEGIRVYGIIERTKKENVRSRWEIKETYITKWWVLFFFFHSTNFSRPRRRRVVGFGED